MGKGTIIYIGGFELPDKNAAAQRVVGNAKVLRELGYDVVFVGIDKIIDKSIIDTKVECWGFVCYSMKYNNKRLVGIDDFKRIYSLYAEDVAAVIAYNYPGIALNCMKRFCRKHKVKIVADCTEWYSANEGNMVFRLIKWADSYLRMKIVQPKLDGMIAISRYLENYYKNKLPTICVPPLVDPKDLKWDEVQSDFDGPICIAYAGSPGKNKDKINHIIEALSQLDRIAFRFEVIGIGKDQYLNYYPEHRELLGNMAENITFLGRVSHQQALEHVKRADFSMFVRDKNRVSTAGFPTKFAESISCGTPVITNRTSNLDEYLEEGKNGFWLTDDLVVSLRSILNTDIGVIRKMKKEMNRMLFDFHGFIEPLNSLF